MFKNKQFEIIHNLLKSKKFAEANKLLIDSRKFGVLHPDYLFLMSMFLMENNRMYLSIDSLLLSLKVDNTQEVMKKNNFENSSQELVKERYLSLITMFEKIKIQELKNMVKNSMEKNDPRDFLEHLSKIMPGIRLKNKI